MRNLYRLYLIFTSVIFFFSSSLQAVEPVLPKTETRVYEFPILDFPYNNGRAPSMHQSLKVSTDFYLAAHNYMLDKLIGDTPIESGQRISILPIVLFDVASLWLPFGSTWMHEEWHRASIGQRGINSTNNIYRFDTSTTVNDTDIQNLKTNHPQDLVRALSAGLESAYELNLELEKHAFFNNHHPIVSIPLHLNVLNNISYMHICTTNNGAGGDCTMWVYELFRPAAPTYQDTTTLTGEEQRYLKKQRNLSLLNLVDPFIFGKKQFTSKNEQWLWNATLRHELTPFGYDIATNVFLHERDGHDIFGAVHLYSNATGTYPGIDVTLPRYPINALGKAAHVTPRVSAWLQPEHLLFRDANAKLGGLASIRLDMPLEYGSGWQAYGELESKTRGWVAGNEYLTSNLSVRFGLTRVFEVKSRWK